MLIKHLTRDEWEVVKLIFLIFTPLFLLPELVIELLLIVEEQELVFKNFRATDLSFFLLHVSVLDLAQEVSVLINLYAPLLLLLDDMLTHLFQMVVE